MNTEDRPATRDTDSPYPREGLELVVPERERRKSELDGAVEYDLEHHWLTYTEWLGEEDVEWGATEIVATEVRPWFGLRVEALFEIMAQDSPPEPRMPRPRPRRLPGWLARLVGR